MKFSLMSGSINDGGHLTARYDYIFHRRKETGRMIAGEAAKNLTPVTLELGGKNACIVDKTADIPVAAKRIAWGKFANAGQTCVAPDYLLVQESVKDELVTKLSEEIKNFYGNDPAKNPDYGKIVTKDAYDRLVSFGTAENTLFKAGEHNPTGQKIAPMILSADPADPVMQNEIFGPVLPVITWDKFEELNALIKKEPLALYIFSGNRKFCDTLLDLHPSGGACINDVIMQAANVNAPFGGVGRAGWGSITERIPLTHSHGKRVRSLSRKTKTRHKLRYPPYRKKHKACTEMAENNV